MQGKATVDRNLGITFIEVIEVGSLKSTGILVFFSYVELGAGGQDVTPCRSEDVEKNIDRLPRLDEFKGTIIREIRREKKPDRL